jgi:hypothetical protein
LKNAQTTRLSSNFRGATNMENRRVVMENRNEDSKQLLKIE